MSRTISLIALLQVCMILVGFAALGMAFKLSGYPQEYRLRWNPHSLFLREHVLWVFFLPLLWTTLVARFQERWSRRAIVGSGVALAVALLSLFMCASLVQFSQPFKIRQIISIGDP